MANSIEEKNVVCKRDYDEKIKRAVVAFANTTGGKVYVGIDDFGQVVGLKDPDEVRQRVKRLIQDGISPNVSEFVDYTVEFAEGKKLIGVEVTPGTGAPYWLEEFGLTREGVLLRKDGATVCATQDEIRQMLAKSALDDRYESRRALRQDLAFTQAAELFDRQDVKLDRAQLRSLGLTDPAGAYSNLAYLISDQCAATIRVVTLDEEARPRERVDLEGSIFRQVADALAVVDRNNKRFAKTRSGKNVDAREYREYPYVAVREALCNAALHREYAVDAPTLVKIFPDKIEILSPGGLAQGLTREELELGAALSRNKNLVELFALLQEADACGLGLRRLERAYDDYAVKPKLDVSRNYFRVTLPNAFERRVKRPEPAETVETVETTDASELKVAKYTTAGISV